jgi:tetratricopeptide (TPR) repeat protein
MRAARDALIVVLWWSTAAFGQHSRSYEDALRDAEELRVRGDLEGVIRSLTPWADKFPDRPEARLALGLAHHQRNDFGGAIRHLSAALKLGMPDSPAWRQTVEALGMAYFFANRHAEAQPLLEKAIAWNPADTYFRYALAMTSVYLRDLDTARRTFAALFDIAPDSAQALVLTSHFLARENLVTEAADLVRQAQEKQRDLPDLNYRLGLLALTKGDLAEAMSCLRKELSLNPLHPMAWHYLGDALIRTGKPDQAITALQRAIWLNLRATESYLLIATAYSEQRKYVEAEQALGRAVEIAPQSYEAHFQLARVYHKTNRPELAKKEMEIASKLRAEGDGRR